jgi:hypothetical protein
VLSIRIVDLDGTKPSLPRLLGLHYLLMHAVAQVPVVGLLVLALVGPLNDLPLRPPLPARPHRRHACRRGALNRAQHCLAPVRRPARTTRRACRLH